MRFWRVVVVVLVSLFLATLFLGGCGQQTTTPQTQEEAETQETEETPTEAQVEAAQNLGFAVWPGTIRVFRSNPDGTTTLEGNKPAFVLFPSPELEQRLRQDLGAEPIALSI
jgi:hypothetical protein